MSKTQQAPPDTWDMDTSTTNQNSQVGSSSVSSVNSALGGLSLNVNAPMFVPNVNAPSFVPSMAPGPQPNLQTHVASGAPGVSATTATSIQNGK